MLYPENNAISTREDAIFRINSLLLENGMNHTRIREILLLFLALNNNLISKGVQHLAGHCRQSRAVITLNIKSLYAKECSYNKDRNSNTCTSRNNRIRTFLRENTKCQEQITNSVLNISSGRVIRPIGLLISERRFNIGLLKANSHAVIILPRREVAAVTGTRATPPA